MKTALWILGGLAVVGVGYAIYQQNQASAAAGTTPTPTPNPSTSSDLGTQAAQAGTQLASNALSSALGTSS